MSDGQALTRKYFIDKLRYILNSVRMNDKDFLGTAFVVELPVLPGLRNKLLNSVLRAMVSNCHLSQIDISASSLCDTKQAMSKSD